MFQGFSKFLGLKLQVNYGVHPTPFIAIVLNSFSAEYWVLFNWIGLPSLTYSTSRDFRFAHVAGDEKTSPPQQPPLDVPWIFFISSGISSFFNRKVQPLEFSGEQPWKKKRCDLMTINHAFLNKLSWLQLSPATARKNSRQLLPGCWLPSNSQQINKERFGFLRPKWANFWPCGDISLILAPGFIGGELVLREKIERFSPRLSPTIKASGEESNDIRIF